MERSCLVFVPGKMEMEIEMTKLWSWDQVRTSEDHVVCADVGAAWWVCNIRWSKTGLRLSCD